MGHTLLGAKNKAGKKRDKIPSSQVFYILLNSSSNLTNRKTFIFLLLISIFK